MPKTMNECTPQEALAYLHTYLATVDVVSEAQSHFDSLATNAATATERSMYRAMSLEAERDLELLVNQRRAFLNGTSRINPPSQEMVDAMVERSRKVASIIAANQQASAVLKVCREAFDAFGALNPAPH